MCENCIKKDYIWVFMMSINILLNVMVIVEKEIFKIYGEWIDRWLLEILMLL